MARASTSGRFSKHLASPALSGFAAWCHEILFARGGGHEENRLGAIRHAHAAIAHGRDDAITLSLGGFGMGMIAHDRDAARQAFEAALAISPSCALTYIMGSVVMALAGDADRGIEWGERALRLSPFDPMSYAPWLSISLGHLQRGEHQAAAEAAHKTFQANPYWSSAHFLLAATHAKLGRPTRPKPPPGVSLNSSPGSRSAELVPPSTCSDSRRGPVDWRRCRTGSPRWRRSARSSCGGTP
jgi:adenylate cyclase